MLNSKMKRSMAWLMTAAVVMTAAPVSAADFSSDADAEVTAEAAEVSEENIGSEENTGEDSFDSVDDSVNEEGDSDAEDISIEDNTENSDDVENAFSDGTEITVQNTDAEESVDDGNMTADELTDAFAVGAEDNSAPYSSVDKLENGTYTVTANVYVPGELNKVLVGTNAFLTNPKYPFGSGTDKGKPTSPVYYNAELNVKDGDITVTLELKNPVFQALQINGGENVAVANKTYNDELSTSEIHTKYGKKIQTITFKLGNYNGIYDLGECKEFASILYTEGNSATEADAVWDVPLKLAVDFQGIGKEVKEEKNYFLNSELQIALVTKNALPEGTVSDMYEITSDATGKDGEVYQQFNTFLKENALNADNYGFRVFYVGLKDANGNNIEDIQQYKPTFYTQATGFFSAYDGQTGQGMARIENDKLTTNIVYGSVGDAESDLAIFETENGEWDYTFKYEENSFTGGYVIIYDTNAAIPFKYHMEDDVTGTGFNYYGVSNTGYNSSQEEEATNYYRIIASKNKRGIGDETLETQLKEKSGYTKLNWNTYQVAAYSLLTDPATNDILALGGYHENKIEIELPIDEKKNCQIYKIVYDKKKENYSEITQVTDYISASGKATILACGLEEEGSVKARTVQRLYGAATDDESYYGKRSRNTIQYYAVVSEGAVADKPSISNTTFTYDGTEKSLIPENQYYTVSGDVSKKLPGSYKVTVTLKDGYAWKDGTSDPIEFTWNIKALQTQKPVAVNGLAYNGKNQTGVKAGKGYNLAGTYTAKNVGSYKAKVLLAEGYEWSDGTTDPLTLTWSIAKAGQAVKTKVTTKSYTFTSLKKKAASFTIGASGQGTISYKVVKAPSKASKYITVDKKGKVTVKKGAKIGTYVVRVSAAGNSNYKAAAKDVTVKVTKLTQKITAKVSGKTYKAASLKKKAATFSIGAKAKTSVSYKVVKAPSKASKYISVSKTGKVTLKKKAPKGTYEIRVTAKANGTYNAAARTIKVVVK